jgi:hypothetical protein
MALGEPHSLDRRPRRHLQLRLFARNGGTHLKISQNKGPKHLVKRVQLLLAVSGYLAVLLWVYATIMATEFSYQGFRLTWPPPAVMVWLVALALAPVAILPLSLSRPSALILWWLYLAAYIPSIFVPSLSLSLSPETLLPLQISLALSMGILCLASSRRLLAIGRVTLTPTIFWPAFVLIWAGCLGFICMYGRANVLANLASVFSGATEYDIRSEYIAGRVPALGYVVGQLGQALNPFLIAFGIAYRRPVCWIAGIAGQIVVFGLTGFKTVLFSAIFLPLVLLFIRRWRRHFGLAFTAGLIAVVLTCAVVDKATNGVYLSSLITRRTLVAPGLLTGFYFEHFSRVSHAGIGYHFHRDESALETSREIGLTYFGSSDVDANANMWAEGFADLGVPGILGFTFLVAIMIWMYDSIAAKGNLELAVLLTAMPAVGLSNTAPTTLLVTHGGLAIALLLYLVPRPALAEEPELEVDWEAKQQASASKPNAKREPTHAPQPEPEAETRWNSQTPFGSQEQGFGQHDTPAH